MKFEEAMDKLEDWWRAAPEWKRRGVIGLACAAAGFVLGFVAG